MKLLKYIVLSCCCIFSLSAFSQDDPLTQICTMDINVWGNSSVCSCPDQLQYSEVTGQCMTETAFVALGRQGVNPSICTKDIGLWGSASVCSCPEGRVYSAPSASCVTDVEPKIVTVSGRLSVTKPAKDIRFAEIRLTTFDGEEVYWLNFNMNQQIALNLDGLPVEIVGERIYLKSPSLNSPAGTLIAVEEFYWLD